jgi:hypothetical protein
MRKAYLWAAAMATLPLATPSQACRFAQSAEDRLASGYASKAISAVALVRITKAGYIGPAAGDAHPWRASATVLRVLRGSYAGHRLSFERGWGSSACDDGRPPPKAGELWVVYFWSRGPGDQPVWKTYPADVARAADPKIRAQLQ